MDLADFWIWYSLNLYLNCIKKSDPCAWVVRSYKHFCTGGAAPEVMFCVRSIKNRGKITQRVCGSISLQTSVKLILSVVDLPNFDTIKLKVQTYLY